MRKRLLWIDDEIEFLRSHIQFLESRGYDVTPAESGDQAIRLIRETPGIFDIILLDKQMPVKSGVVVLEEIKALCPSLPVIMITGYQHSDDANIRVKMDGYLTKPIDPGMILVECKRIIDSRQQAFSKTADKYLRGYTENRDGLSGAMGAQALMNMYHEIAKWDVELENVSNEGVRQMHAGLKSDFGKKFCDCVGYDYVGWVNGKAGRPTMSVDIMPNIVVPELRAGKSVFVVVLSGMRLDQFLSIEPELKRNFTVGGTKFMSLFPTTSDICMSSLVSGLYPSELHGADPGVFKSGADIRAPEIMKRAMSCGLERIDERSGNTPEKTAAAAARTGKHKDIGLKEIQTASAAIGTDITAGRKAVVPIIETMKTGRSYTVVTLDMMEFVIDADHAIMSFPESARRDDAALRMLVRSRFVNSPIIEMMKAACSANCTVVLTSDHGHIFCNRPTELYDTSKIGDNYRCLYGKDAAADDRAVFFIDDLKLFKLPPRQSGVKCFVARENYYFTFAEKFGSKRDQVIDAFRYGGMSPEEMVLPAYVCRPKA